MREVWMEEGIGEKALFAVRMTWSCGTTPRTDALIRVRAPKLDESNVRSVTNCAVVESRHAAGR